MRRFWETAVSAAGFGKVHFSEREEKTGYDLYVGWVLCIFAGFAGTVLWNAAAAALGGAAGGQHGILCPGI